MQKHIIACPPKEKRDQRTLGLAHFTPSPGSTTARCSKCGIKVWIGQKQREAQKQHGYAVQCFICTAKQKGSNIQSLGGTGATYIMTDGKIIAPVGDN